MTSDTTFADLGLSQAVLESLARIGYEAPTPIQAQSIPPLLDGRDLLGTAQTGTGKTAAFALPLLSRIHASDSATQVLVLAPTRELAIQVSEAFENYARGIRGFHVLPIYGGQSMGIQLKQLRRGAQVVVGTPGRVMDHLRRGTLKLDALRSVVLDEADEMLRMGFIEDVQWILEHTPDSRQVALFSATMPHAIQRVADTYLKDPAEIRIESKTSTVERIEQKFWIVAGTNKLDALTRILEVEDTDGVIVFVRTKLSSENLASRLEARGHAAAAINGDLSQAQREATIARLKSGAVDILVATDVAARGIDVDRISHVVNFDIPTDTESYVHRIGRTGRAGRTGTAILFVAPRERRLLHAIERATRAKMVPIELPSKSEIDRRRTAAFKDQITETLQNPGLGRYQRIVESYLDEHEADPKDVAAAIAMMLSQRGPAPASTVAEAPMRAETGRSERDRGGRHERADQSRPQRERERERAPRSQGDDQPELELFRLAVGREHGAKPGDIVGAIANEAELDSRYIGRVRINDDHTTVELPVGMPDELLGLLQKVRVRNTPIRLQRVADASLAASARPFKAKRAESDRPKPVPRRRDARQGGPRTGSGAGGRRSNEARNRGPGAGPRAGEGPRPKLKRNRD